MPILDRSVHALDLIVGPEMFGLGEAMFDIVTGAGHDKRKRPEELLPLDLLLDVSRGPTVVGRIGEVSAIFREDGMNLIRHDLDEILQEVGGDAPGGFLMQLCGGELQCSRFLSLRYTQSGPSIEPRPIIAEWQFRGSPWAASTKRRRITDMASRSHECGVLSTRYRGSGDPSTCNKV